MRCDAFEDRLNDLLDRRLRPEYDARLVSHAQKCPRCSEMLSIQRIVIAELGVDVVEPSPSLSRRIAQSFSPAITPIRSSAGGRSWRRWAVAAVAACVAVAMIPSMRERLTKPGATVVATVTPPSIAVTPDASSPLVELPAPIVPPAEPVAELARGLGQSMARGVVSVPGVTSAVGPMSLIDPVVLPDDLAAQLEPLRPLAAPVAAVVDLLLKSLPRLSDRPDARSSRVVDLRQSLI